MASVTYENRKAAGVCVKCGGPRDSDSHLACSTCRKKTKDVNRRQRERLRKQNATLDHLLACVAELFRDGQGDGLFSLVMLQKDQWRFRVIDDWALWTRELHPKSFTGKDARSAVRSFLEYVEANNVDVKSMQYPTTYRGPATP